MPFLRKMWCAIGALALLAGTSACSSSLLQPPPQSDVQDSVNESLVRIQLTYPVYVQLPDAADARYEIRSTLYNVACSGAVVTTDGYVLTAGHCVDPTSIENEQELRKIALQELQMMGRYSELSGDSIDWRVIKGKAMIKVWQPQAYGQHAFNDGPLPAHVVNMQESNRGDNGLLRIDSDSDDFIALPIAEELPLANQRLESFGFATKNDKDILLATEPDIVQVRYLKQRLNPESTEPKLYVAGKLYKGMSGGPTVDADGAIVGVNSSTIERSNRSFISDTKVMRQFLQQNGAGSALRQMKVPAGLHFAQLP